MPHGNQRYPTFSAAELNRELAAYMRECFRASRRARATAFAARLNLPRAYVSKVYHRTCGQPLVTAIQERQVRRAKLLLGRTKRSTIEIARRAAFGEPNSLYRVFLSMTGVTPTEYRKIGTKK